MEPAWRPALGLRLAAAREAEAALRLRTARTPVQEPLRGGAAARRGHRPQPPAYLELRLDNVAFRTGWARTRPQARQFAGHGLLLVNGRRVTIPSIRLRAGDEVELGGKAEAMIVIRHNLDTLDVTVPAWLERSADGRRAVVLAEPTRDQIHVPVNELMVVELYSR